MTSDENERHEALRVDGSSPGRLLIALILLVGMLVVSISFGNWREVALVMFASIFVLFDTARRAYWKGRPIVVWLAHPATLGKGLWEFPRDPISLCAVIVANVVGVVMVGLFFGFNVLTLSVGLIITSAASTTVLFELRRRDQSSQDG